MKYINRIFLKNTKSVYRKFRGNQVKVNHLRAKYELEHFCKGICCQQKEHNSEAEWLKPLETEYCASVINLSL